eukprot:gene31961-39482_t
MEWTRSPDAVKRMYKHHRHFLQVINSQFGPQLPSHWILKEPGHLSHRSQMLETYPDAKFIWAHRNILDVARTLTAKHADGNIEYTKAVLQVGAKDMPDAIAWRRSIDPLDSRFCDVYFEDLMCNPVSVVRAIYAHYHMPLSEQHVTAMNGWLKMNFRAPEKHSHIESKDFGFPEEHKFIHMYRDYLERFPRAIPPEYLVKKCEGEIVIQKK